MRQESPSKLMNRVLLVCLSDEKLDDTIEMTPVI